MASYAVRAARRQSRRELVTEASQCGAVLSAHKTACRRVVASLVIAVLMLTIAPPVASAAPSGPAPAVTSIGISSSPIVLGLTLDEIPDPVGEVEKFGGKVATGVFNLGKKLGVPVGIAALTCNPVIALSNAAVSGAAAVTGIASVPVACAEAFKDIVKETLNAIATAAQSAVMKAIASEAKDAAVELGNEVLSDILAGDGALTSPRLDPDGSGSGWFIGEFSLMRSIGIFIIIPLAMIVIMQSIIKGSMFFLLRAMLVLFPIAVFGSIFIVEVTDLLLSASDEITAAIASNTSDMEKYQGDLADSFKGMDTASMTFFSLAWMFLLIIGMFIIILELLLRSTGVYLAAFFLPLAFSALVWPATGKWARRLVEVLVGLIFSKVFIAAALSLGISGFAATAIPETPKDQPAQAAKAGEQELDDEQKEAAKNLANNENGTSSAIAATAMMMMAAYAGAKIITIAPGASAALEGKVLNPSNAFNKVQAATIYSGTAARAANKRNMKLEPKGRWRGP